MLITIIQKTRHKPHNTRKGHRWHGLRFLTPTVAIHWRQYKRSLRKSGAPLEIRALTINQTLRAALLGLARGTESGALAARRIGTLYRRQFAMIEGTGL